GTLVEPEGASSDPRAEPRFFSSGTCSLSAYLRTRVHFAGTCARHRTQSCDSREGCGRASDERGHFGAVLAARPSPGAAGAWTVASLGLVVGRDAASVCQSDGRGDFRR